MHKHFFLYVFFGLALFSAGAWLYHPLTQTPALSPTPEPIYREVVYATSTPFAVATATYPEFPSAPELSVRIKESIDKAIAEHASFSEENWKARVATAMPGESLTPIPLPDERFSFVSTWEKGWIDDATASILIILGGYQGGAHGYTALQSFNYDLKNHKDISLESLYPGNPTYLAEIAQRSQDNLRTQFIDMGIPSDAPNDALVDGTAPRQENFRTFTFTPTSTTLYFQEYQVGPYVLGTPRATLSRP
jgi:hypothetical protein